MTARIKEPPARGIPLAGMRDGFNGAVKVIADGASADAARKTWKAVAAPAWHRAPTWLYGDLHPANVVVQDGTLSALPFPLLSIALSLPGVGAQRAAPE